jgi:hypothetical protein
MAPERQKIGKKSPERGSIVTSDPARASLLQLAEFLDGQTEADHDLEGQKTRKLSDIQSRQEAIARLNAEIAGIQESIERLALEQLRIHEKKSKLLATADLGTLLTRNSTAHQVVKSLEEALLDQKPFAQTISGMDGANVTLGQLFPGRLSGDGFHNLIPLLQGETVEFPPKSDGNNQGQHRDSAADAPHQDSKEELSVAEKTEVLDRFTSIKILLDENSELWDRNCASNGGPAIGRDIVIAAVRYKDRTKSKDRAFENLIYQRELALKKRVPLKVRDQQSGYWNKDFMIEFLYKVFESNNNCLIEIDPEIPLEHFLGVKKNFKRQYEEQIERRTKGKPARR